VAHEGQSSYCATTPIGTNHLEACTQLQLLVFVFTSRKVSHTMCTMCTALEMRAYGRLPPRGFIFILEFESVVSPVLGVNAYDQVAPLS